MEFVVFNNEIIPKEKLNFYSLERFRYADACFESMLLINGKIPFLKYHQDRLNKTCDFLGFQQETIHFELIKKLVETHQNTTKFYRIRYSLVRAEGVNYLPNGNKINVLIECIALNHIFKEIDNLGFYSQIKKPINLYAQYKTANALLYVMVKQFALQNNYDEVLLLNDENNWIESSSSNIFAIINNDIYTTKENSGAVVGTSQKFIKDNFKVKTAKMDSIFLSEVNELFLTNGVQIIQPVKKLNNRKLHTSKTQEIIDKVKEIIEF
ncbi:MAG: aminotransferase class IV [Chitinophagales bacterium]|nr:aminotransferase class IV [Bacteroidota bacterium]MCB9227792.1 aminotransferase class IV [Chitinophagales bacterium]